MVVCERGNGSKYPDVHLCASTNDAHTQSEICLHTNAHGYLKNCSFSSFISTTSSSPSFSFYSTFVSSPPPFFFTIYCMFTFSFRAHFFLSLFTSIFLSPFSNSRCLFSVIWFSCLPSSTSILFPPFHPRQVHAQQHGGQVGEDPR